MPQRGSLLTLIGASVHRVFVDDELQEGLEVLAVAQNHESPEGPATYSMPRFL